MIIHFSDIVESNKLESKIKILGKVSGSKKKPAHTPKLRTSKEKEKELENLKNKKVETFKSLRLKYLNRYPPNMIYFKETEDEYLKRIHSFLTLKYDSEVKAEKMLIAYLKFKLALTNLSARERDAIKENEDSRKAFSALKSANSDEKVISDAWKRFTNSDEAMKKLREERDLKVKKFWGKNLKDIQKINDDLNNEMDEKDGDPTGRTIIDL